MQLDKIFDFALFAHCVGVMRGVQPKGAHGLPGSNAVRVGKGGKLLLAKAAGHRAAAKQPGAKPRALFFNHRDKLDGVFRHNPVFVQHARCFQPGDDTGGAVKIAAVFHRIKMAPAHHDRRGGVGALHAANDGTHRVGAHGKARLLHLLCDILRRFAVFLSKRKAGQPLARRGVKSRQCLNIRANPLQLCSY